MYLNKARMAGSKILNGIVIALFALPAIINIFVLVFAFTELDVRKYGIVVHLMMIGLFFFMLLFDIGIIIWRVWAIKRLTRARIYNSMFEEDHDGIITYDSIASMTGNSVAGAVKELMWLVNHNYIVNITLGRTAARVDVLPGDNEFVVLSCPCCGAHVNIRKGGGGKCEHCGTFMREKEA